MRQTHFDLGFEKAVCKLLYFILGGNLSTGKKPPRNKMKINKECMRIIKKKCKAKVAQNLINPKKLIMEFFVN